MDNLLTLVDRHQTLRVFRLTESITMEQYYRFKHLAETLGWTLVVHMEQRGTPAEAIAVLEEEQAEVDELSETGS